MESGFFETVRNAFEGFVVEVAGRPHVFVHHRGLKVWYGDDTREHYESQLIRRDGWRRISEVWPTPHLDDIDEAIETAARLADYVIALEPVRRVASGRR